MSLDRVTVLDHRSPAAGCEPVLGIMIPWARARDVDRKLAHLYRSGPDRVQMAFLSQQSDDTGESWT